MVGSSGVDRRKGTDADDYGYGRRSSLYSNGRRAEGRTCGAGVAASATRIINVGGRWMDERHLCRLKAELSPTPGSGEGGADCFGWKARVGEEMTLLGEDDNRDPPGP